MTKLRVSEKINYLFSHYRKENGKSHTYQEVSEGTGLATSHIWKMRNGEVKKPSPETLEKIREYFNAPSNYFDDVIYEDDSNDYEQSLVMRSRNLTDKGKSILSRLLDGLLSEEGLSAND